MRQFGMRRETKEKMKMTPWRMNLKRKAKAKVRKSEQFLKNGSFQSHLGSF